MAGVVKHSWSLEGVLCCRGGSGWATCHFNHPSPHLKGLRLKEFSTFAETSTTRIVIPRRDSKHTLAARWKWYGCMVSIHICGGTIGRGRVASTTFIAVSLSKRVNHRGLYGDPKGRHNRWMLRRKISGEFFRAKAFNFFILTCGWRWNTCLLICANVAVDGGWTAMLAKTSLSS